MVRAAILATSRVHHSYVWRCRGVVANAKAVSPSKLGSQFSQLPQMSIEGNTLTVEHLRNTRYRTLEDYDYRYENRRYDLSQLQAIDFSILFWGSETMSHPMAVFDFGLNQHLCISMEVRYRENETYNILGSIYRQNELMYVVSDERDAILRRTRYCDNQDMRQPRYLSLSAPASKNRIALHIRGLHPTN